MSIHTMEVEIDAEGYPHLAITFEYSPGCPAYTPRGEYAPIDPPEPPEVQFISATFLSFGDPGAAPPPDDATVDKWGRDYLENSNNFGFNDACNYAEHEPRGPDPDEAYDRKREDAEWDRQHPQRFDDEF